MGKPTESTLQQNVCEYLSICGVFHFAVLNETAVMLLNIMKVAPNKKHAITSYLKKMGLVPGIPDLCILNDGKVYFLELKTDKGKLSESQERIIDILDKGGYNVEVAYGFEEAINILIEWGVV